MENTYEIRKLSQKFYTDYSQVQYPQILRKNDRPVTFLLVETHDGFFIGIPFRSHMSHNNGYHFVNSARSKKSAAGSGLDYSKICIVTDSDYIDAPTTIDNDEYKDMKQNIDTIVNEAVKYVDDYINHVNGTTRLSSRQYRSKYWYSTLPYFHKELGI